MDFGKCKVCREYGMLVHEGACSEHARTDDIEVRLGFMNMDDMKPSLVNKFSNAIHKDIRVSETNGNEIVKIVLSEMEIIVVDNSSDPIQTVEYKNVKDVGEKTEIALDWVYSNL